MASKGSSLEILDRLGVGGVAEVFRAIRRRPGAAPDLVVVKKMRQEAAQNPFFSERFHAEADLLQMLHHPNVAGGHEVGLLDGQPYVTIDYVDGRDLGAVLRELRERFHVLDTAHGVYIVMELLRGLDHVHQLRSPAGQMLNVVHRDVTPENVLLGYDGSVALTDFGVALLNGIELQGEEPAVGKLGYLAPEQVLRQPLDGRTDLFAVGCILYELCVGQPAFPRAAGEPDEAVLERLLDGRVARPTKVDPAFPRDLEKILLTALERKPRNRFPTAARFLAALDELAFARSNERALLADFLKDFFWLDYRQGRVTLPTT
ncbi:MAG: serine/threonine protein kinase [Deltaproteobacteria bacterium]|nr:serine/threonine protein kinase [Deltaproteobacteria bacterium]